MCVLVAVGVLVYWPALTTRFFLDDYLHEAMVHGRFPAERGPFDLYDFVGDDDRQALFDRGFLPWWTDPHVALRFLRPLSSALLFYTHLWLAPWPILMHLHFFAWWVVAVLAARDLFACASRREPRRSRRSSSRSRPAIRCRSAGSRTARRSRRSRSARSG